MSKKDTDIAFDVKEFLQKQAEKHDIDVNCLVILFDDEEEVIKVGYRTAHSKGADTITFLEALYVQKKHTKQLTNNLKHGIYSQYRYKE